MSTFTVYSAGCNTCKNAVDTLKSAIADRGCRCSVEEIDCDGHCDAAKKHGFEGKDSPIIMSDETKVHEGALSEEHAEILLLAK